MPSAADNLVKKYPTRTAQLRGPVYDYLSRWKPLKRTDQDLYMAVFHPDARGWPSSRTFPKDVRHDNPGINTPQDYINLVNRNQKTVTIKANEEKALKETADKLGVSRDSLYKLINFESGWNPQAKNSRSGARGLIQFMPSTAAWMGFKKSLSFTTLLAMAAAAYYLLRRKR